MNEKAPFSPNGGLTLVPFPEFHAMAKRLKSGIEERARRDGNRETPVDIVYPEFNERSNGEPFIKLPKRHIGGHDCIVLTTGPGTYEMLGRLCLLLDRLSGRRAHRIAVYSGYFPLGRSDKDEGSDELAMPSWVVSMLEASAAGKLDRIISADLHAPQVVLSGHSGLITEVSYVRRILQQALVDAKEIGAEVVAAFADDSSAKRMEPTLDKVCKKLKLDIPRVYATGRRSSSTQKTLHGISGDVQRIQDAVIVNLDDEVATCGTNENGARVFKAEYGAREVWAAVTHGVFCGRAPELLANPECALDRVYVSSTIPVRNRKELRPLIENGKIRDVSTDDDLCWIFYNHHWNESIREIR